METGIDEPECGGGKLFWSDSGLGVGSLRSIIWRWPRDSEGLQYLLEAPFSFLTKARCALTVSTFLYCSGLELDGL